MIVYKLNTLLIKETFTYKMVKTYAGAFTALITPFDEKFQIDYVGFKKNIEFQIEEGISGIVAMGTTGESATVTHEEHSEIIARAVKFSNKKCVVIGGTGSNSTEEAIMETAKAQKNGVDAVLLVDCYYNKPSSLELRNEYYGVLADEFPRLDIIPYVIPSRTGTVLSPEDLALLHEDHKNIVAVKEATGDLERMRKTRCLLGMDFNIISGDDFITFDMMTDSRIKSCGVISVVSNIVPRAVSTLCKSILNDDIEIARKLNDQLKPLFGLVGVRTTDKIKLPNGNYVEIEYKFPNPVPIKTMMNGLGMLAGPCKRPLGKMTKSGVEIIRNALKTIWQKNPEFLAPIEKFYGIDVEERLKKDKYWEKLGYSNI